MCVCVCLDSSYVFKIILENRSTNPKSPKASLEQNCSSESEQYVVNLTQAIQQAEEGLRDLEGGISELKRWADKLQVEQSAVQELSKLQVPSPAAAWPLWPSLTETSRKHFHHPLGNLFKQMSPHLGLDFYLEATKIF